MIKKQILTNVFICIALAFFVSAGSFEFRGATDKMGINEAMGDVLEVVGTTQLSDLKTGSIATKEGSTKYAQYIRFKDAATTLNTSSVQFTETEDTDEVGEFLIFNEGTAVTDAFFEWHINFDEGLKSKITDKKLESLEDVKISIFNEEYTIIDAEVNNRDIELTLAKGAINDILRQQEKKVYTIGDNAYEIEVSNVETSTKKVKFKINGKETGQLEKGNIETVEPGIFIGVNDVIPNSNDPSGTAVKFFIGASVLEFRDENYQDNSFTNSVNLNKEKINGGFIKISASLIGEALKISDIKYRLANSRTMYVKPGETVKKYLQNKEGMLADWDIRFTGLETVSSSRMRLIPSSSNDEYRIEFTTTEDKVVNIPFVSNKNTFKLGDSTKDLIIVEGASTTDFNIDRNDYFVLTTANAKNGKTYVLTYDSLNNETSTVIFTEIGGSQRSATYTNGSDAAILGEGTLSVGAIAAKFYIEAASPNRLVIDMNGDDDVASDQMDLILKGGGILDPGTSNAPAAPLDITLTTDGTQFEESTTAESMTFTIQTSQTTRIGISDTIGSLATVRSQNNHLLGLSNYGVKVDLLSSTDTADSLTVDYPQSQMFAKTVIDMGTGSKIATKVEQSTDTQCTNKIQDGDETGIDCGGSCNACPTCSDNLKNQGEEGIDCGGPCPKVCAPQDQQSSEACDGCWQTLEKGKKNCLPFGTVVGTLYCSKSSLLVPLKKNGEACVESYECKTGYCEEGKCGRKLTFGLLVMNSVIILLILAILYYVFTLLK